MIDWLDELGKDWGYYMRSIDSGFPSKSALQDMVDYHQRVSGGVRDKLPINENVRKDVLEFHQAWRECDALTREVIFVVYYNRTGWKKKAAKLGLSKTAYYENISKSQVKIWSKMNERSGRRTEHSRT